MKKDEKNLLVLIGIIILLALASKPQFIYDVFNINFGGTIIQDVMTSDCNCNCPSNYEFCVCRLGPDSNNIFSVGLSKIIAGGSFESIKATNTRRCLVVGYTTGSYSITTQETFSKSSTTRQCKNTPADVEFCLVTDNGYSGYAQYRYVLIAESNETASGLMSGVSYLRVPIPNPPTPSEIDLWAIFNQLFSMIWSALKALFGWLT